MSLLCLPSVNFCVPQSRDIRRSPYPKPNTQNNKYVPQTKNIQTFNTFFLLRLMKYIVNIDWLLAGISVIVLPTNGCGAHRCASIGESTCVSEWVRPSLVYILGSVCVSITHQIHFIRCEYETNNAITFVSGSLVRSGQRTLTISRTWMNRLTSWNARARDVKNKWF